MYIPYTIYTYKCIYITASYYKCVCTFGAKINIFDNTLWYLYAVVEKIMSNNIAYSDDK